MNFLRIKENELKSNKTSFQYLSLRIENVLAVKSFYFISLQIGKSKRDFTIGENLIIPSMVDTC